MKTSFWLPATSAIVLAAVATLLAAAGGCDRDRKDANRASTQPAGGEYSCPMHPQVRASTAGTCPQCGMQLQRLAAAPHSHASNQAHDVSGEGEAVRPHADHTAKHGGMLGMQGDYHIELVVRHGGDLAVYLYDSFTKPLAVSEVRGSVAFELPAPEQQLVLPLQRGTTRDLFVARSPAADRALSATVELQLADITVAMTFPLQATLTGEIVDVDCFVRLGEQGRGAVHAECARACIGKGLPVGLCVGNTVYLVTLQGDAPHRGANARLTELAGRHVTLTGRVNEANGIKIIELADVHEAASKSSSSGSSR